MEISKRDWKLYREKIPVRQENYIGYIKEEDVIKLMEGELK